MRFQPNHKSLVFSELAVIWEKDALEGRIAVRCAAVFPSYLWVKADLSLGSVLVVGTA